jgi:CHAT domain-containing protein/tetratricopeptide (TPR) repeat protein
VIVVACLLLLSGQTFAVNALTKCVPQNAPEASQQTATWPLERELAGGEVHSYRLRLTAGQFIRAIFEQRGIDILVTLSGPDGEPLLQVDNPVGAWGPEPLFFETPRGGAYTIEVRARKASASIGRYQFSMEARRAGVADRLRLPADRVFAEGTRLLATAATRQPGLDKYAEALGLFRSVGDREGELFTLGLLGSVSAALGDEAKAQGYFDEALAMQRDAGDRAAQALTLRNVGLLYLSIGDKQNALDHFNQSSSLFQAAGDKRMAAVAAVNTGATHDAMGERQKALDSFLAALPLFRAAADRRGEAYTLNSIGLVYGALGDKKRARDYHNQSLEVFRAIGSCNDLASVYSNSAEEALDAGDRQKALEYLNEALAIQRSIRDREGEARTLNNIGFLYNSLGDRPRALEYLGQALLIHREVENAEGEGDTLSNLMFTWRSDNKPQVAIFYGKQAVNLLQKVRGEIPSPDKEAQKSFIRSHQTIYHQLADLLIARGRLLEAQQVLGMLKEDEYFEFTRRSTTEAAPPRIQAEMRPEESELQKRYQEIAGEVAALGRQKSELLGKANRNADDEQRLSALDAKLGDANKVFQNYLNQLSVELANTKAGERVEQVRDPQDITRALRELGAGAVALYTVSGEDKYRVILITPNVKLAGEYPIRAADLNSKVLAFREALENPKRDPAPLAKELYQIIVGPVAKQLRDVGAETLMWSLDGPLRYIPVGALNDGQKYLVESYRNVVFTPASMTRLTDPPVSNWTGLGYGVSKAKENFAALPSVPAELRGIIREAATAQAGGGVLSGKVVLDEAFTAESFRAGLRERYPLVHIASHFQFQPGNETDSFLLLGDGTHLSLAQMKSAQNLFGGVELLTLSACNTATSGIDADGKEVEGFAVLAQRQGAKAVLASLWPVADESTKLLMQNFYRLRDERSGKAEALRGAQLSLLRNPAYAHPYYWAPFILIGNWK